MTRVMGDSAQYLNIPGSVQVAAFYGNGAYAVTIAQAEARFPHAKYGRCWIDVLGTLPSAQARDWETGDKSGSLEQWVIDHNKASGRKDAVVYCTPPPSRRCSSPVRRCSGRTTSCGWRRSTGRCSGLAAVRARDREPD